MQKVAKSDAAVNEAKKGNSQQNQRQIACISVHTAVAHHTLCLSSLQLYWPDWQNISTLEVISTFSPPFISVLTVYS